MTPVSLMHTKQYNISDYSKKDEEVDITFSLDMNMNTNTFSIPFVSKLKLPDIIGIKAPSILNSLQDNNPIKTVPVKNVVIPDAPTDFIGSSLF